MNTDKTIIQRNIEKALRERLSAQNLTPAMRSGLRRPTRAATEKAMREQAAFIAGAGAALQAVFGEGNTLTDYFPPSWFISTIRGELI